ncbi:MAG: PLD nuclease N-terminal domain-containing protein [Gammaproteobacteria bacterium]|nr:PLD nuclease N-terminal domain-containing protein [Gammaproteobacteria bacterium]
MMSMQVGGFFGFLVLVADIWAILNVVQSRGTNPNKLLWVLAILFLPVLGFFLWLFFGPRGSNV